MSMFYFKMENKVPEMIKLMKEDLKIDIFDFKQRAAQRTFLKDKITDLFNCFTVREMIDTKTLVLAQATLSRSII